MSASKKRRRVKCLCDCGTEVTVRLDNLTRAKVPTLSCGCLRRERVAEFNRATKRTHGMRQHELYNTWNLIRERCNNPQWRYFADYGGRGIALWAPWIDPVRFIADIERELGQRPAGCTLDRINNDGNYEPGNVRWATYSAQSRNQRQRKTLKRAGLPPRDVLLSAAVAPGAETFEEIVRLLAD